MKRFNLKYIHVCVEMATQIESLRKNIQIGDFAYLNNQKCLAVCTDIDGDMLYFVGHGGIKANNRKFLLPRTEPISWIPSIEQVMGILIEDDNDYELIEEMICSYSYEDKIGFDVHLVFILCYANGYEWNDNTFVKITQQEDEPMLMVLNRKINDLGDEDDDSIILHNQN